MGFTGTIKLVKGNITGYLEQTLHEKWYQGKIKWVTVLAFVDEHSQWLYTGHWRINGQVAAVKELESLGWSVVEQ